MKRVFCSILAGLMMLSMFTGCSSSQNSSAAADGEKTVVELWTVWKTDKTTPRLIQFHTLKNAANPPFLGGFSIFGTVAA